MSLLDAQVLLRRHFVDRYHREGAVRVLDCAGNAAVWDRLALKRMEYFGYDAGRAAAEGAALDLGLVEADIVDVGGGDPWGSYADVLDGFAGRALTVFLLIPDTALRLKDGLARYVLDRVGAPIDWSRWEGPGFDSLVMRAGLSYALDSGFAVEDAQAVYVVGKPFPWRYNHVGMRLCSSGDGGGREGSGPAGVQGQGGAEGGEPPPARP
jgi:hypothetical protein